MLKKPQATKIYQTLNQTLNTGEFSSNLKKAGVTPVFKRKNPLNKEKKRLKT